MKKCVLWKGAIDSDGYGRKQVGKKWKGAHRVIWEEKNGVIPKGLVIDHLCRNRACVNTEHMEVVTVKENTLRGFGIAAINARKKVCVKGHTLEGNNLMIMKDGRRWCRECGRSRWRAYRLRRSAKGNWDNNRVKLAGEEV